MKKILYIGNQLFQKNKTPTSIDTLGPLLEKEGYQLRYASSYQNKLCRLLHMVLMTYRNKKWAQLVLIDTYSTKNFWYAIIVSRLCIWFKLNYIPILHGGNLPKRLSNHPKIMNRFLNNAAVVVTPSDYLYFAFAKANYNNIITIPNCIEMEKYTFTKRTVIQPKMLWVRSFAEIYNPQMAVKVLYELKKKYPHASLTMVGPEKDSSLRATKLLATALNLDVTFTGLLSKKEWCELSKKHDVFINTTYFDNLPVSLIEAMALGLPVISTAVGGIPFLIKDNINGKLTASNDAAAMAQGICNLIESPLQTAQIIANARICVQVYSWKQVRNQWQAIL